MHTLLVSSGYLESNTILMAQFKGTKPGWFLEGTPNRKALIILKHLARLLNQPLFELY
jgi:hypothetical protein